MTEVRTLCGNCGTDFRTHITPDHWVTVIDWRRDVLCPRCRASYTWLATDWHILLSGGRLLGYVRRGALAPGRHVIMHTAFSGDITGEVVKHHTNTPGGEWNGVTSVQTTVAVPGYRSTGQVYDVGTITLEPAPEQS